MNNRMRRFSQHEVLLIVLVVFPPLLILIAAGYVIGRIVAA